MERRINGKTLRLLKGDITTVPAGAIANAANSGLRGGGGVDGAIHRAGGPSIMKELNAIRRATGGCPTGGAVITGAGNLPAKYVLHAVGPVYRDGRHGEPERLASAYSACLKLAAEHGVETVTFPSISTGVYGYPLNEAAPVALATVAAELARDTPVKEVTFVLFDRPTYDAYQQALAALE